MDTVLKNRVVTGFRRLFIFVSPNETSFERLDQVPNYVDEAVPFFIALVLLEWMVLYLRGQTLPRLNDGLSSLSNGLLSLLHGVVFRSTELAGFLWAYKHINVVTLPWNNPWTWVITLLAVDFAYYWVHRFGHELNFMWAGHQTHHSSEEYNLTTALRQSALQPYYSWIFYLPLALFLPPTLFLVHNQFNLLYQFWVHTETIGKLGPLEWIMSTPSHHRVHHGRNPYCIDKNYGGVFIIWDRMFGTFEEEKDDDKPVYGLVHNIDTWQPLYAQLHHLWYIITSVCRADGWSHKMSILVKGPGWGPGKPRLGLPEDLPPIEENPVKYDSNIPVWKTAYVWTHFLIILMFWHPNLAQHKAVLSSASMAGNIAYIIYSLFVFGAIYNKSWYADYAELLRCCLFVAVWKLNIFLPVNATISWIFVASAVLWSIYVGQSELSGAKMKKKML